MILQAKPLPQDSEWEPPTGIQLLKSDAEFPAVVEIDEPRVVPGQYIQKIWKREHTTKRCRQEWMLPYTHRVREVVLGLDV